MTTQGVGWSSEEASDLVAPPLNLVLYIHLRIFAYTSNALIASFEYMELILASGTLKNFRFLLRSCLSTDRAPVIKLICSTGCTLGPDFVIRSDEVLVRMFPTFDRNCEVNAARRYLLEQVNRSKENTCVTTCCLLLIDKSRAKDKTYI